MVSVGSVGTTGTGVSLDLELHELLRGATVPWGDWRHCHRCTWVDIYYVNTSCSFLLRAAIGAYRV